MQIEQNIAGALSLRISDSSQIRELIISGELNGKDIALLRSLCGCERSNPCSHPPVLEKLDLSEARIIAGGFVDESRAIADTDIIGEYMFAKSSSLKICLLPETLVRIASRAFFGSRELKYVRTGRALTDIGEMAFMNCSSLEELELTSDTSLRIGRFSFGSCRKLATITLSSSILPELDPTAFSCPTGLGCKVIVPESSLDNFRADSIWRSFELSPENGAIASQPEPAPKSANNQEQTGYQWEEETDIQTEEDILLRNQTLSAIITSIEKKAREREAQPKIRIDNAVFKDHFSNRNGETVALVLSGSFINLKNVNILAEARLYHAETGKELQDTNNEYSLPSNQVGVVSKIVPLYDNSTINNITFPIPYTELHLGSKSEMLIWKVSFFVKGKCFGGPLEYQYLWSGIPCARVSAFNLDSGVSAGCQYIDGILSFKVNNALGKKGRCILYFSYHDGRPVKDTNGSYCTFDGQVSSGEDFTPKFTSSNYADFRIRIPTSELHLDGISARLKAHAEIFLDNVNIAITESIPINWNLS